MGLMEKKDSSRYDANFAFVVLTVFGCERDIVLIEEVYTYF